MLELFLQNAEEVLCVNLTEARTCGAPHLSGSLLSQRDMALCPSRLLGSHSSFASYLCSSEVDILRILLFLTPEVQVKFKLMLLLPYCPVCLSPSPQFASSNLGLPRKLTQRDHGPLPALSSL